MKKSVMRAGPKLQAQARQRTKLHIESMSRTRGGQLKKLLSGTTNNWSINDYLEEEAARLALYDE